MRRIDPKPEVQALREPVPLGQMDHLFEKVGAGIEARERRERLKRIVLQTAADMLVVGALIALAYLVWIM